MLTLNELLFILIMSIPFLMIPTAVAWYRGHPQLGRLAALNIFGLLLFGIGWILALIWAITEPDRSPATLARQAAASNPDRPGDP